MFPGFGTIVNVATVIAGSAVGLLLGNRLPDRTRRTVTDALGLVTLLIGAISAFQVTSADLSALVGPSAPVFIVLGALLIGGIGGSLRSRFGAPGGQPETEPAAQARFIEGFVTSSLVFCVGPLTILGALSDGLGLGANQLILKAVLDGFAAIAFAASFGVGVMASALTVLVVQAVLTLVGFLIGDFVPAGHLAAITATGGLLLVGVGLRLLQLRMIPVGDLLPALVVAPLLAQIVALAR